MASRPQQQASPSDAAQQQQPEQQQLLQEETLISSPPGLWLPTSVVKRHRKTATVIWIALLGVFFAYVFYIVYDGFEQRRNPAASMEVKEEVFTLPDIAVCVYQGQGCYTTPSLCMGVGVMGIGLQSGFIEEASTIVPDEASLAIQEAHPHCKVLPTSKMTVDQTGIANGDIAALTITLVAIWLEDPLDMVDEEDLSIFGQFASIFFVDVDAGPDVFGASTVDARLPYERVTPTANTLFTTTQNDMILTLTEFTGISAKGQEKETRKTFTQRTTSGDSHWFWTGSTADWELAFLLATVSITNFEFNSIKEVDPMDAWTIIGAIGGIWQFVVIGFGLFFVFAEKQLPEYKLRNFRKSANKPVLAVRRLSSTSSKGSTQDVVVNASSEDLPVGWIKKRRSNGSMYYHNNITGSTSEFSPHDLGVTVPPSGAHPPSFQAAYRPGPNESRAPALRTVDAEGAQSLPPGWVAREDERGGTYYLNTIDKTIQWTHPTQRASSSTGGRAVQMVDAPVARKRHGSASSAGAGSHAVYSFGTDNKSRLPPDYSAATASCDTSTGASGTGWVAFNPPRPTAPTETEAGRPRGTGHLENTGGPAGRSSTERGDVNITAGTGATAYPPNPATESGAGVAVRASGGGGGGAVFDSSRPKLASNWEKAYTKEGKPFYINHILKKTKWHLDK